MDARKEQMEGGQKVFVDEINQIRLINPILIDLAKKLALEGRGFTGQFSKFLETVADLRETMGKIGSLTDRERLKLLSLQSQLESKREDAEETQQLKNLIGERQKDLERLNVELGHMRAIEAQQKEYLTLCKKI